jgi:hypothetical protein
LWFLTDLNGDGLDDLVFANPTVGNALYYGFHNGAGLHPDLATSFTDGYGVNFSPTYVSLADSANGVYGKGSNQVYPQQDYIGPLYVAPSYTASDGIGGAYTMHYAYSSGIVNLQGRGFEGFGQIRTDAPQRERDSRLSVFLAHLSDDRYGVPRGFDSGERQLHHRY